jgi:hypothetical protein
MQLFFTKKLYDILHIASGAGGKENNGFWAHFAHQMAILRI